MTTLADTIRQLDGEGTPGPWELYGMGGITSPVMDVAPEFHATCGECGEDAGIVVPLSAEDAALIVTLRNHAAEIADALEAVERVRELHWGYDFNGIVSCHSCGELTPCPTIRALDGER